MCGIFAAISRDVACPEPSPEHLAALQNRGPDLCQTQDVCTEISDYRTVNLKLLSTVLALRGDHLARQPLVDESTNSILCWNGEGWKFFGRPVDGNDGELLCQQLSEVIEPNDASGTIGSTLHHLQHISGPYSFVYYDSFHQLVYFARDCIGRRSLLYNVDDVPGTVLLSSIAGSASGSWKEVEADGIYVLALDQTKSKDLFVDLHPCPSEIQSSAFAIAKFLHMPSDKKGICKSLELEAINSSVPKDEPLLDLSSSSVGQLGEQLANSLRLRILNIPEPPHENTPEVKLAVLFSGGLDCTVLARMAHGILPLDHPIDLLNVAFENPRVVLAAKQPPKVSKKARKQKKRSNSQPGEIASESPTTEAETPSPAEETSPYESCPDRITGRSAFAELLRVCPSRQWRFVAVNIPYTEFLEHKPKVISLIYPHNTEMDLSIAAALYFASRGVGLATTSLAMTEAPYTTSARVLLSGLGADELFGGYTRHGNAFARSGYQGLIEELELDVGRLGKRNLGRDDRAISNWRKEARFPFLDEDLVRWALNAPVWEKCGFGTRDEGVDGEESETKHLDDEKKVLRLLAWKLGMHSVAAEKKRAIQFGARTAKMETGRSKGTTLLS